MIETEERRKIHINRAHVKGTFRIAFIQEKLSSEIREDEDIQEFMNKTRLDVSQRNLIKVLSKGAINPLMERTIVHEFRDIREHCRNDAILDWDVVCREKLVVIVVLGWKITQGSRVFPQIRAGFEDGFVEVL